MIWRGLWDGQWDGSWEGASELAEGSMRGVARITIAATGTATNGAELQPGQVIGGGWWAEGSAWTDKYERPVAGWMRGVATIAVEASGDLGAVKAPVFDFARDDEEVLLIASGWR